MPNEFPMLECWKSISNTFISKTLTFYLMFRWFDLTFRLRLRLPESSWVCKHARTPALSRTWGKKTAAQGHKAVLGSRLKTDAICPLEGTQETRWLPEEMEQNGEVVGKGPQPLWISVSQLHSASSGRRWLTRPHGATGWFFGSVLLISVQLILLVLSWPRRITCVWYNFKFSCWFSRQNVKL